MSRNRVIYQSEALFVSPLSTGFHATNLAGGGSAPVGMKPANSAAGPTLAAVQSGSVIQQLKRVQSANYSFTVNRQDVNQFGQLSRIDSLVVDTPTVTMDFSYLLTDGENETLLNFVTDGNTNTISGHIDPEISNAGQNFFILTVPEGQDAFKGDSLGTSGSNSVISLGNGFLSDYSMDASVGAFPTATVTVEGFNITSTSTGVSNIPIPAIDPRDGSKICDKTFSLPATTTGSGIAALRPGDITIDLQNAGLFSKQVDGNVNNPVGGSAHIQSVSISLPLSRSVLQRLGNTFGFSREIDFPVTATMTVNALVSELKDGNMLDLLCGDDAKDLSVTLRNPECIDCVRGASATGMIFSLKGAILESESYSSAIGDNKTVDLTFSTQVGGPTDTTKGVFISGTSRFMTPPAWTGTAGGGGVYFFSGTPRP